MPRPRHKDNPIIRLSRHPSRSSLCFDSKLVVVVVVIGLMESKSKDQVESKDESDDEDKAI